MLRINLGNVTEQRPRESREPTTVLVKNHLIGAGNELSKKQAAGGTAKLTLKIQLDRKRKIGEKMVGAVRFELTTF